MSEINRINGSVLKVRLFFIIAIGFFIITHWIMYSYYTPHSVVISEAKTETSVSALVPIDVSVEVPVEVKAPIKVSLTYTPLASNTISTMSIDNTAEEPTMEPVKEPVKKSVEKSSKVDVVVEEKSDEKIELSNKVLDIFARLVLSEAGGEPYEGKVAVAAVVLNRVDDQEFPDSITDVIFQRHQFAGTKSALFDDEPTEDCIQAVKDALAGEDPTDGALYFLNKNDVKKGVKDKWDNKFEFVRRIGNHWFYKPKS